MMRLYFSIVFLENLLQDYKSTSQQKLIGLLVVQVQRKSHPIIEITIYSHQLGIDTQPCSDGHLGLLLSNYTVASSKFSLIPIGSQLLKINEKNVSNLPYEQIRNLLMEMPLPIKLFWFKRTMFVFLGNSNVFVF